ncbi:MAG TPA: DUF58 domain-containing protein [Anaerolineae bacterium]|nr:DUF58 domain-containing protein [Anaerolineae bacterium]
MSEYHISLQSRDDNEQRLAKQKLKQKYRQGEAISVEEFVAARGLKIKERENSIFGDSWLPLSIIFIILGYFTDSLPFITLGFFQLALITLSRWWKDHALDDVIYLREVDRTHLFAGEPLTMTTSIRNAKPLPLSWLRIRDTMPVIPNADNPFAELASDMTDEHILENNFTLAGYEEIDRQFELIFPRRGYYRLGPVAYASGDIFTLFTIEKEYDYTETIIVYPPIWSLEELGLPAKEPFGDAKVRHSLFTDPIKTQGIRDYQVQDRFRDIHWKATARRNKLQTKIYDPSTGMTVALFLNVSTLERHWLGFVPEMLEWAVSVAASIAHYAVEQRWGIGLYANGSVPRSDQPIRVPPSRSPDQLTNVLEALAAVTEFATSSIEGLLQTESPRLAWAATIVVVTAVVNDPLLINLHRLKEAGRRVVLISIAEERPPQDLAGLISYHIPADIPAYEKNRRQIEQDIILTPISLT